MSRFTHKFHRKKNVIKFFNKSAAVALLIVLHGIYAWSQERWSFDKESALLSHPQNLNLHFQGVRDAPELVPGIVGKAWRTDGYSTWLSGTVSLQSRFGVSGWFALESFPTDTAAFFAIHDSATSYSLSLCIDRFGEVLVGEGKGDTFFYRSTGFSIQRFQWVNAALSVENHAIFAWVNGEKITVGDASPPRSVQIDEIRVAKDFRNKQLGLQDLTIPNGLIDELKLWDGPINPDSLRREVETHASSVPALAIPKVRFENDFARPKYHLLPAANWTNETHGLIFHKGKYHIFNQKNASNLFLRQINWGHFSSPDLINWTEHKPALTPERGYDQNGIWSGHVVINDDGIPTIAYTTGGEKMGVGIAFPNDPDLLEWTKYEKNPVIWGQPEGYTRTDLRDPYVWKERDKWYLIIGFGIEDDDKQRGTLLLYSSSNLKEWEFIHTLYEGNPEVDNTGIFWEMPIFEKIGEKYVLLINKVPHNRVPARAMYWVGDFRNEKFIPDNPIPRNLEVVNRLLSPSLAKDEDGRITTIAIIPDEIGEAAAYQHGWTHLYSIPRVWNLKDGKITQTPHPHLETLRDKHMHIPHSVVSSDGTLKISEGHHQLEVKASITPNEAKRFGFIVNKNPDGSEFTKIYYDVENQEMVVDQTHSSLKERIPLRVRKDSYHLNVSKSVDFHVFIDGSVVEIFVNEEDAFTTRIFPLKESSNCVEIFAEGGNLEASADVWTLKAADMRTGF